MLLSLWQLKTLYKSKWVQKEVTRAQRINKPFFPLLLSGNPWLSIESTQYVDVRDKSLPPERFYKRLSSVTPRNRPVPASPPPRKEPEPQKPIAKSIGSAKQEIPKSGPREQRIQAGINAIIIIAVVLLGYGINYIFHLLTSPKQSPTPQATSTFDLSTATKSLTATPELPTETLAPTFAPPTPTLGVGSTMISPKDGMKLLYVPAGNFLMGSTDSDTNANYDEKPQHVVYLNAYRIDQTDVTNAMYAKCVSAGACNQPTKLSSFTRSRYYGDFNLTIIL